MKNYSCIYHQLKFSLYTAFPFILPRVYDLNMLKRVHIIAFIRLWWTPLLYDDKELSQDMLVQWLVAWWYQAITSTIVDKSMWSSNSHLREVLQIISQLPITKIGLEITHSKSNSSFRGTNELILHWLFLEYMEIANGIRVDGHGSERTNSICNLNNADSSINVLSHNGALWHGSSLVQGPQWKRQPTLILMEKL